jgi:hypothetical protein
MANLMSAELNKQDVENLLKTYSPNLVRKAIRSGLDKTATWSKNYLADLAAKNYNIKSSAAKKTMKVERTTQTNLSSSVESKGSGLSLIDYFNATQDAAGVTAIIAPGWIKRTPHAFVNRPRSSKKKVVMLRKGKSRYPTTGKAGWGPPIPSLLRRSKVLKPAMVKIQDHLYKELEDQITKRTKGQTTIAEIE